MEDMNAEYDQGVDVRGIAPWDDGLTKREREAGKADFERKGDIPPEVTTRELQAKKARKEEVVRAEEQMRDREQQPRKRKLWLGIW